MSWSESIARYLFNGRVLAILSPMLGLPGIVWGSPETRVVIGSTSG